eukprot:PLAT638.1.p1 GENE.PLAT638.1~~PLAT638.1.p1  ORF type:complete len:417 (+),score=138.88 PLAT638.1:3-1253(+)
MSLRTALVADRGRVGDGPPVIEEESSLNGLKHSVGELGARYRTLRSFAWDMLSVKASKYAKISRYWPSRVFECIIISLILCNLAVLIMGSVRTVARTEFFRAFLPRFDLICGVTFTAEYCLRLWACVESPRHSHWLWGRLAWMRKPLSVLDLLAILPFYADMYTVLYDGGSLSARSIGLYRIISFLRLERQSKAFKQLRRVLGSKKQEMVITFFIAAVAFVVSSTLMYYLEAEAQPERFRSVADSAWWAVAALTTVTYGDIRPVTTPGKILAGITAFVGIMLFALPAGIIGSGLIEATYRDNRRRALERKLERKLEKVKAERPISPQLRRSLSGSLATFASLPARSHRRGRSSGSGSGLISAAVAAAGASAPAEATLCVTCPHCSGKIDVALAMHAEAKPSAGSSPRAPAARAVRE